MEKECNVVVLDGTEYTEVNRLNEDNNTYVILVNLNDTKDFCIKKLVSLEGKDYIRGLDNKEEFDKIFKLFVQKNVG